jgi:hypothetical protein
MTIYPEYELRCDGVSGDPFGCSNVLYATSRVRVLIHAAEAGWKIGRYGKGARCPHHQKKES